MPRRVVAPLRRAWGQDRGRPERVCPAVSRGSGMRASHEGGPRGERLRPPRAGLVCLRREGAAWTQGPPGAPPDSQRGGQPGEHHAEWGANCHAGELAMLQGLPLPLATGQDRRSRGPAVAGGRGADVGSQPGPRALETGPCEPKRHGGCQTRVRCQAGCERGATHKSGCTCQTGQSAQDRSVVHSLQERPTTTSPYQPCAQTHHKADCTCTVSTEWVRARRGPPRPSPTARVDALPPPVMPSHHDSSGAASRWARTGGPRAQLHPAAPAPAPHRQSIRSSRLPGQDRGSKGLEAAARPSRGAPRREKLSARQARPAGTRRSSGRASCATA